MSQLWYRGLTPAEAEAEMRQAAGMKEHAWSCTGCGQPCTLELVSTGLPEPHSGFRSSCCTALVRPTKENDMTKRPTAVADPSVAYEVTREDVAYFYRNDHRLEDALEDWDEMQRRKAAGLPNRPLEADRKALRTIQLTRPWRGVALPRGNFVEVAAGTLTVRSFGADHFVVTNGLVDVALVHAL